MSKKEPIFKDNRLNRQLEEDGFVKLPFIADTAALLKLQQCYSGYKEAHEKTQRGFHHTTHLTQDWTLVSAVNESLQTLLNPFIFDILQNVGVLGANFIVKGMGSDTTFQPHQDWTLVDEEQYFSVNMWVALEDINIENGALRFLKGSHHIIRNLRMAPNFPPLFEKVESLTEEHLTSVCLKAGEAVVFDCGVLHGSFANLSNCRRVSAIIGLYSKNAPFKFYYNTEVGTPPMVEEYNILPEEFLTFAVGDRPKGREPDKVFPYAFPQISTDDFNRYLSEYGHH